MNAAHSVPVSFTEWTTALGLLAGFVAVIQFGIKIFQDKLEFRRRQAQSAISMANTLYAASEAVNACNFLDYEKRAYNVNGQSVEITKSYGFCRIK